ncbi:MAG: double zinc ribbon domain-containing protein [Vicinamibacterales bacterium]
MLSHVAAVGGEVSGIICPECGEQNDPAGMDCRACAKTLAHTCPRCAESLATGVASCPSCGLWRQDFFDECVRQDLAARKAEARRWRLFAAVDDTVLVAVLGIMILLAWWQELRPDAWEWKAWLGVTVWFLVMWAFAKSR